MYIEFVLLHIGVEILESGIFRKEYKESFFKRVGNFFYRMWNLEVVKVFKDRVFLIINLYYVLDPKHFSKIIKKKNHNSSTTYENKVKLSLCELSLIWQICEYLFR